MKLICHIGTPHSAAPLLQYSFAENTEWLAHRGIVYANSITSHPDHFPLALGCANTLRDMARNEGLETLTEQRALGTQSIKTLADQIAAAPENVNTVVMSSEQFSADLRHPDEIKRLKEFLTPLFDEIEIVIYVRRQDDAVLAAYDAHLRQGLCGSPFREFVSDCLNNDNSPTPYLYYFRELAPWVKIWGRQNIILRRYAPADFIDGNIIADFMGIVQKTWAPDLSGFKPAVDKAPTLLSAPALEFLRQLHPNLGQAKGAADNGQHRKLQPYFDMLPQDPRPIVAKATAQTIMKHFSGANTWLKNTFGSDLAGPFFPERPDHPEHSNLGQITTPEMAEFSGKLLADIPIGK